MDFRMYTVDTTQISLGQTFFLVRKIHILSESVLSTYDFLTACSLESLFRTYTFQFFDLFFLVEIQ